MSDTDEPTKRKPIRHPSQYLLVNYQSYQPDEFVRPEDELRAANGYYYTKAEVKRFCEKTQDHCPVYGSCTLCLRSGPIGKRCDECNSDDAGFTCYMLHYGSAHDPEHSLIIDSCYLAEYLDRGHEKALGRRRFNWIRTPMRTINFSYIDLEADLTYSRRKSSGNTPSVTRQVFKFTLRENLDGSTVQRLTHRPPSSDPTPASSAVNASESDGTSNNDALIPHCALPSVRPRLTSTADYNEETKPPAAKKSK